MAKSKQNANHTPQFLFSFLILPSFLFGRLYFVICNPPFQDAACIRPRWKLWGILTRNFAVKNFDSEFWLATSSSETIAVAKILRLMFDFQHSNMITAKRWYAGRWMLVEHLRWRWTSSYRKAKMHRRCYLADYGANFQNISHLKSDLFFWIKTSFFVFKFSSDISQI